MPLVQFGKKSMFWSPTDNKYMRLGPDSMTLEVENIQLKFTPKVVNEEYITVETELLYDYKESNLWSLDVETELELIFLFREGENVIKRDLLSFDKTSTIRNCGNIMTMEYLNSVNNGRYLKPISLNASFIIRKIVGIPRFGPDFRNRIRENYTFRSSNDAYLQINDVYIGFVDKYPMLCFSSLLREKLLNGYNHVTIELEDGISVDQFLTFFELLYGQRKQLTDENIEPILKLAIKYDVQFMISNIEDFLISSEQFTILKKLRIAEIFGFSKLQTETLKNVRKDDILQLSRATIRTMNYYNIEVLLLKICGLSNAENSDLQ